MFEELFWRILEEFVGMNLMKSSHCCCCCKLFKTTTAAQHPQHFNSQCTLSITYRKIHVEVQRIDIRQYTFYIVPMNMFHLFHIKILFMTL